MTLGAPAPTRPRFDPFRWIVEHPGVVDVVVFGTLVLGTLAMAVLTGISNPWWVFSVPMFAAGMIARTRPGLAALVIGVLATLHFALGIPAVVGDVMIFYALFCATAHGGVRTRRLALAAAFLGALLQAVGLGFLQSPYSGFFEALAFGASMLFFGSIAVLGTWAIGKYQHARLEQLRLARDRAVQAERDREQRAALAVADERARIAREMHDVVAHSLSVIIAQADGGRFVASQDPEAAARVLGTIGTTGRAALADMRSLLGVLRSADDAGFGPQPDLRSLPELLTRVRATGLAVSEEVVGPLDDLQPSLGLSMFRLVQEALTNVLKHAGPGASASVRIHRGPAALSIDVLDDGRGHDPASDGNGQGLTGMRERVALHGGTLLAGPLPAGGFRVSARIPLSPNPTDPRRQRP